MKAYVFPGQGAQFVGMGKDLYESSALAKELFEKANDILGFRITDLHIERNDFHGRSLAILTAPFISIGRLSVRGRGVLLIPASSMCTK